jgi:sulfate/thiosulfate transport system ATP-binding protein
MSITAKNICKKFGKKVVLDQVTVEAPSGNLVALLGPSGSGKTTLLRIIAGLETADSGNVLYQDDDVTQASAKDRNIGFVFQHYALFRHMTVYDNVAFGLRVRKLPEEKIRNRVMELLQLVRLEELANRYPSQLSGGQKQRIALIRSLAPEPKVLLLDEPFGALDAKIRAELRAWLRRFHDEFHVTSIFVTHDQEEAFEVADKIVIMKDGQIEQTGTPSQVFEHPATPFVMDFLGQVNKFPVTLQNGKALMGKVELPLTSPPSNDSGKTHVYIRPHELDIDREFSNSASHLAGKVIHINPAGSVVKVRLMAEEFGLMINVDLSPERYAFLQIVPGDIVFIAPKRTRIFEAVIDYAI